jgi:Domain of unknown function (DUF1918)
MEAAVGDRIVVEAENVTQRARGGVIEEVIRAEPPRFRIRWDDGRETIIAPTAGAARIEHPSGSPGKRRHLGRGGRR